MPSCSVSGKHRDSEETRLSLLGVLTSGCMSMVIMICATVIGKHAPAETIDHRQRYSTMSMANNSSPWRLLPQTRLKILSDSRWFKWQDHIPARWYELAEWHPCITTKSAASRQLKHQVIRGKKRMNIDYSHASQRDSDSGRLRGERPEFN
jgi:hypothetical protein